ncbi:MAG: UDP-N-acetylmuramate--L-alanine ligase [Gemmatimonadota bacterium]|nr:MAG: UDP-N-acetylmuramate--L-alanine ligase [Gemmatimonadota bacterium]
MTHESNKNKHIHFIGIGGEGMSGIAEVVANVGYRVSGCDLRCSEVTERLQELGVHVYQGHDSSHLGDVDFVVYSAAVSRSNPEIVEAQNQNIPIIPRAEMLADLMRIKFGIGVAGTHGKTTTTSLIGSVLTRGGLDPTIVVGGKVRSFEANARLGESEYFVVEADEFDRSFLRLSPSIAVITTLEAEHLECYTDLDDLKSAFVEFANKVPFYGSIILCIDEESLMNIVPRMERSIVSYGLSPEADVRAVDIEFINFGSRFTVVTASGAAGRVQLRIPGIHNVKNALAAVAVGGELKIPFETIRQGIEEFTGVHRRFEMKGVERGVTVVDDYGHHPTEIQAALKGARHGWDGRIIAVFQPHLYTRTWHFYREFGRSFFDADVLVVTDIYPAREKEMKGVTGELVAKAAREVNHPSVLYIQNMTEVPETLFKGLKEGDLLITFGAGDIWTVGEQILEKLRGPE